jgi:hypothetical protein
MNTRRYFKGELEIEYKKTFSVEKIAKSGEKH